jgi:hypothetical protein
VGSTPTGVTMVEILTPDEAAKRLDDLALNCENENYHTLAGMLWDTVIPMAKGVTERTQFVIPVVFDGVLVFIVEPE